MKLAALGRIGFLTLPGFSMIAAAGAIEVLRMANRVNGKPAFSWTVVTPRGDPAPASNGLTLSPTLPLDRAPAFDLLLVCGGIDVRTGTDRSLIAALRRLARTGMPLGALCTGTFALAEAGLLRGYRCAIHWENLEAVAEEFPGIDIVGDLFVIDRDRITCTGGVAPLDLMLQIVEARLGRRCAGAVSAQFIIDRKRSGMERQPSPVIGEKAAWPAAVRRAIALVESSPDAAPRSGDLAQAGKVSVRQLERLFRQHTGLTPAAYSLALRLDRARRMLRQTALPVTEVGLACGFKAAGHFSNAYRGRFGRSPRADRLAAS